MRKKISLILSALFFLVCCGKWDVTGLLFGSSPDVNERFASSQKYNEANGFTTISVTDNEYSFYVFTDAHVNTSSAKVTDVVNTCITDKNTAPFVIFLGDGTSTKSLEMFFSAVSPLENAGIKLFWALGNHDIFYGLWSEYINNNNTASYYFEVVTPSEGKDLFINLDSASGTIGVDQRAWLGKILSAAEGKYRHITVFTHTHFFKRDNSQHISSNFILEEGYDLEKLFSDTGVSLVLTGHNHYFDDTTFKNVRYLTLAALEDTDTPAFYIFNFNSEEVTFKKLFDNL